MSLFALFLPNQASAVVSRNSYQFPSTGIVERQRVFWEKIFDRYPSTAVVIHDVDDPSLLIDVIDSRVLAKRYGDPKLDSKSQRDKLADKYIERYALALERFRKEGKAAKRHGAIEQRVFAVYGHTHDTRLRLYKGRVRLRSQTGLADTFIDAAGRAQTYMEFMETTFRSYNIPPVITRLAFVESMFNIRAKSKVGASGIWQFMPRTAQRFMYVNRLVDERNSPFKATIGAAKLLSTNFSKLGHWPLAITAYNHGLAGIQRAVRKAGSKDLNRIIKRYESRSFGFASKNFYAEFLAAANVYDTLHLRGILPKRQPADYIASIPINRKISIAQILRYTPLDRKTLKDYNPCLHENFFRSYRYRPLPPDYEIYVPKRLEKRVRTAMSRIRAKKHRT